MFETMLCNKQLNYIGKSLNTPNDRSNDTTSKFLYKTSIVIPSLVQSVLIGNKGANIKKLQNEFGVKMRLIGDNWLDYPNGRTLQILGDSEGKIIKARKFIDEEYILKKWEAMNIGQRFFTEAVDEQNIVYKEVVVPKVLTTRGEEDMAKMQKSSGIIEYLYRDSKQNGMRIIILRGTKDAVSKAEMELKRLSENIPKKANSVSSEEKYESEIRELRSENEKLKRQVELKDRELVRLNGVRACFGCNSAQRSIIFLPCAHFLLCIKCSEHNEVCLICNLPRIEERDLMNDSNVDNKDIPKRISPLEIFVSDDGNNNNNNYYTSTTTQSSGGDLLSKMLINDMDESVRPMEM
ncbi:KH domain-containing protein [Meloidogyne graminicola]|uniref:KH domain-containing protein n=1 Tax=Meloidogyne graminicola TaxID=189291 RepID=A0A8T0A3X1_9BILA|nr:KH domain-containing protein [Meloidogyne graminicola]